MDSAQGLPNFFLARIWSIPSVYFFTCKLCIGDHESWTLVIGTYMRRMITLNVLIWSSKAWLNFVFILIWTFISIFFCPDFLAMQGITICNSIYDDHTKAGIEPQGNVMTLMTILKFVLSSSTDNGFDQFPARSESIGLSPRSLCCSY